MARNKYPEQTIERIITVSAKLFAEKGYEKTTMQDILDELKLSKGAVYHHFKSKEEILEVVIDHWLEQEIILVSTLASIVHGANGKEKTQNFLMAYLGGLKELFGPEASELIPMQTKDPRFLLSGIIASVEDIAPILAKLIEEGVADKSLQIKYPLETAEVAVLLLASWAKPMVFKRSEEQTKRRLEVLADMYAKLGMDVLTDEMINQLISQYRLMNFFSVQEK